MSQRCLRPIVLLLTLAVVGCATAPGGGTIQYTATDAIEAGGQNVTVNVDASELSGDRREVFLQQAGTKKITNKVLQKLWSGGGKSQLPDALNIRVTGFRLRSGSSGFWLGSWPEPSGSSPASDPSGSPKASDPNESPSAANPYCSSNAAWPGGSRAI